MEYTIMYLWKQYENTIGSYMNILRYRVEDISICGILGKYIVRFG